jgi:uncharacterized membrane protein
VQESNSSPHLTPERMAAFSDGVIAVIITIMVLELKAPGKEISDLDGLRKVLPLLIMYGLSFIEVGIYWVNHHYMLDDVEHVSHGLLWANLGFLFTLSLIPFGTAWVGERGLTPFAISLYSVCCALPAVSWFILSAVIGIHTHKPLAGNGLKQAVSSALYAGAIPVSYHSEKAAILMIATVSVLWLIPPRRVREMTRNLRK